MQRYRSGHNEAVLKTVCPGGRVGSNPTLCVIKKSCKSKTFLFHWESSLLRWIEKVNFILKEEFNYASELFFYNK